MQICLSCNAQFSPERNKCSECTHQIQYHAGMPVYAPDMVDAEDHFPSGGFSDLYQLEASHFWFRSRNRLILWALQKFFPGCKKFLEIGCGTGYVLSAIGNHNPQIEVFGSELSIDGLLYAAKRLPGTHLLQMDARRIPFVKEFDAVGLFDVLEHIPEDNDVLEQCRDALVPGGGLIVTVPQHQFLWSVSDEYACHVRRYSKKELKDKLCSCGFEIIYQGSFVTLLMPLLICSRIFGRAKSIDDYDPLDEYKIPAALNYLLEHTMTLERQLIKTGITLPLGGSLICIARTKDN